MQNKSVNEMIDIVIFYIEKHFGDRCEGTFSTININEDKNHQEFVLKFILYDYFAILFVYDRGNFGATISAGDYGVGLDSTQKSWEEADLDIFMEEIKKDIELRIPDKYLKAKGWLGTEVKSNKKEFPIKSVNERVEILEKALAKYFGKKITSSYTLTDVNEKIKEQEFAITFQICNYDWIEIKYIRKSLFSSILKPKPEINTLLNSRHWEKDEDVNLFMEEMKKRIELEIPSHIYNDKRYSNDI